MHVGQGSGPRGGGGGHGREDHHPAGPRTRGEATRPGAEGTSVVEASLAGSSGSNGVVERTVQAVEEEVQVRWWQRMVAADEPFVTYIPDHAMHLINRLEVGKGVCTRLGVG